MQELLSIYPKDDNSLRSELCTKLLLPFLLCLLVCINLCNIATAFAAEKYVNDKVVIVGNEIYHSEILLQVLEIKSDTVIRATMCSSIWRDLLNFYNHQGYILARVWMRFHDGILYISIDEGKLEKIIVRGRGRAITAIARWLIELPYDVYNKGLMDTKIALFKKRFGFKEITTKIVHTARVKNVGFQLSDWGINIFNQKASTIELHVIIAQSKGSGPSLGIFTSQYFGYVPFVSYTTRNVFFKDRDDVLKLKLETGYNLAQNLNSGKWEARFTHVQGAIRYDFPTVKNHFRFFSDNHIETSGFQRPDLPLDEYWQFILYTSINAGVDFNRYVSLFFGGSIEYRSIYSIRPVVDNPYEMRPFDTYRASGYMSLKINLNPDELRVDRRHLFSLEYQYFNVDISDYHRLTTNYSKVFSIGYDDFIAKLKGVYTFGATPFYDELPLGGSLMRNFFKGLYFIDKAGWLSFEYRLSLWKDVIKISIFFDMSAFGQISHAPTTLINGEYSNDLERSKYALAGAFGPGFHWLILDTFQFNIYASYGVSNGKNSMGYYFTFRQVYF